MCCDLEERNNERVVLNGFLFYLDFLNQKNVIVYCIVITYNE